MASDLARGGVEVRPLDRHDILSASERPRAASTFGRLVFREAPQHGVAAIAGARAIGNGGAGLPVPRLAVEGFRPGRPRPGRVPSSVPARAPSPGRGGAAAEPEA